MAEIERALRQGNDALVVLTRRHKRALDLLRLDHDALPAGALASQIRAHVSGEDVDPEDRAAIAKIGG